MDEWIGKKVFIELNSGRRYAGKVIETSETLITIIDKYNKRVEIAKFAISVIQEEER